MGERVKVAIGVLSHKCSAIGQINKYYVVEEHSRRTEELVVNHSRRFYESPRSIDTFCNVSRKTAYPDKRKIGEPRTQLSIHLGDSTNLREGLVWNASILKKTILNRRTLLKI
jgi:hypothetical protein